jgi:hypothetical protein
MIRAAAIQSRDRSRHKIVWDPAISTRTGLRAYALPETPYNKAVGF